MNFKHFIFLLVLMTFSGCGVKSDPVPPPGTQLPSYVDKFLDHPKEKSDKKEEQQKRGP